MCIAVFLWKSHPLYPFLLLLNRDEFYNRPTTPLGWWEDGEILGGRDGQAGGTWLACTKHGKLAFLTNVREIRSDAQVKSRGELPVRFLKGTKSPKEFAEELVEEADKFHGFNLIVADLRYMTMVYVTNRHKGGLHIAEVSTGIHVLSNAQLDTPWPKALRLRHSFEDVVEKFFNTEISLQVLAESVMKDTSKDDGNELPGIYSPHFEYLLSSIFVEAITPMGRYGTRSTSALVLGTTGQVSFYETYLENDEWKEQMRSFHIEKNEAKLAA